MFIIVTVADLLPVVNGSKLIVNVVVPVGLLTGEEVLSVKSKSPVSPAVIDTLDIVKSAAPIFSIVKIISLLAVLPFPSANILPKL